MQCLCVATRGSLVRLEYKRHVAWPVQRSPIWHYILNSKGSHALSLPLRMFTHFHTPYCMNMAFAWSARSRQSTCVGCWSDFCACCSCVLNLVCTLVIYSTCDFYLSLPAYVCSFCCRLYISMCLGKIKSFHSVLH